MTITLSGVYVVINFYYNCLILTTSTPIGRYSIQEGHPMLIWPSDRQITFKVYHQHVTAYLAKKDEQI